MDILIYEYFLGEDFKINTSPLILNEAKLITNFLIEDLKSEYTESKISLLINKKNKNFLEKKRCIFRNYENNLIVDLCKNLKENDKVFILAPEENLNLYNIVKALEEKKISNFNCKSNFIYETTCKLRTQNLLKNSRKHQIKIHKKYQNIDKHKKIVAKISDGLASENLLIFNDRNDLEKNNYKLNKNHVFQEYIEGKIIGINLLINNNGIKILSINEQIYKNSSEHEIFLYKINIGKFNYMLSEIESFIKVIFKNLDGYFGFIGVDAIITDSNIFFLEINPRLTTSYIGLRKTLGINPFRFFNDNIIDYDITQNSLFTLSITNEK